MAPCSGGPHARGRRGACGVRPIARPRRADLPHRMVQWCDAACSRPPLMTTPGIAKHGSCRSTRTKIVYASQFATWMPSVPGSSGGRWARAGYSGQSLALSGFAAAPGRHLPPPPHAKSRGTAPMNPHALALGLSLPVLALAGALPVQHAARQDRAHCLQRERPAESAAPRRGPRAGSGSLPADDVNPRPSGASSANRSAAPREPCPHGMSRRTRRVMLAMAHRVAFAARGSRAS
jgi:hypothetical protein